MNLKSLIEELEKLPPGDIPPIGFANPHSYRGYYDELAFEPTKNVSFGEMLEAAKSARGATFEGYKGGKYTMHDYTDCYLAAWGRLGEEIGSVLISYMAMTAKSGEALRREAGE